MCCAESSADCCEPDPGVLGGLAGGILRPSTRPLPRVESNSLPSSNSVDSTSGCSSCRTLNVLLLLLRVSLYAFSQELSHDPMTFVCFFSRTLLPGRGNPRVPALAPPGLVCGLHVLPAAQAPARPAHSCRPGPAGVIDYVFKLPLPPLRGGAPSGATSTAAAAAASSAATAVGRGVAAWAPPHVLWNMRAERTPGGCSSTLGGQAPWWRRRTSYTRPRPTCTTRSSSGAGARASSANVTVHYVFRPTPLLSRPTNLFMRRKFRERLASPANAVSKVRGGSASTRSCPHQALGGAWLMKRFAPRVTKE